MEGPRPLGGAGRDGDPRLWQVGNVAKMLVNLVILMQKIQPFTLTHSFDSLEYYIEGAEKGTGFTSIPQV